MPNENGINRVEIEDLDAGKGEAAERHSISLLEGLQDYEALEAFKTLRTNIGFSGENMQVVCVTSALPGDGKSTVSYNLARAFASAGKKTLLIDADMRKSVMRKQIWKGGDPGQGLVYYLSGHRSYDETVCATNIRTLDVIFSGQFPPNPSELLGSRRFAALVNQARNEYRIIIIDTPPIGSVIDAAVVAGACDGAVLVLKDGAVSRRLAQRCRDQLEAAKAPILGCVLNEVDLSANRYYGHYYGKYYGKYYGE